MKRVVIPLLAFFIAACDRSVVARGQANSDATSIPRVDVVRVISQRLSVTEPLPGELAAWQVVAIYPKVRGFVDEIPVDRGSAVRKGQLLVRLSAPELLADRAKAEATLRGDRTTFEQLREASETKGAVSENELKLSRERLRADQEQVRSLSTLAGYLTITAPFDGIITERNIHPGALVGAPPETLQNAVPMLRIEQIARLRLVVAVPEADADAVSGGSRVQFRVRASPGRLFTANISRISHWVDPKTRTMAVEADADNRLQALDPGMFAEVLWPVSRREPTLFVPASAIVDTSEATLVERVKSGRVERVAVRRGKAMGEVQEVFGSLAAGDLVILHGSEELANGARVIARSSQL
jgi:membrane fusion protein (multidrug efflux system)